MLWTTILVTVLAFLDVGPQATLRATYIGNAAVQISDGQHTLMTDFPYESGASGYMTYDRSTVRPTGTVTLLITHAHRDHFSSTELLEPGWRLVAPARSLPNLPAQQSVTDDLRKAGIDIKPLVTPHSNVPHQSYRVEWHGQALYFTGDTEDTTVLLNQKNLDVAFVTPWLWNAVGTSGASIDARQVIIYHHTADEVIPGCSGRCLVPKQGDQWEWPAQLGANPQVDQSVGGASETAAADLARLKFLVGEWTVQNFVKDSKGEFILSPAVSLFRARYLRDGLSLMAESFEERRVGFYGFHVVTHDPQSGLVHRYFDARRNQRIEFAGQFRDGQYDITRRGGYNGSGDFLYRETDSEITANSFVKRIYRSDDEGRTWTEGDYYFAFARVR